MAPTARPLIDLAPYLSEDRVVVFASNCDKPTALTELAHIAASASGVRDEAAFINAIFEREEVSSTGIGAGVAVPHAKLASIDGFSIAVGIAANGIDYSAVDGQAVQVMIMIAATVEQKDEYLRLLASVASRIKDPDINARLCAARNAPDIISLLSG